MKQRYVYEQEKDMSPDISAAHIENCERFAFFPWPSILYSGTSPHFNSLIS